MEQPSHLEPNIYIYIYMYTLYFSGRSFLFVFVCIFPVGKHLLVLFCTTAQMLLFVHMVRSIVLTGVGSFYRICVLSICMAYPMKCLFMLFPIMHPCKGTIAYGIHPYIQWCNQAFFQVDLVLF